jgi:hypothetical protein
VPQAVSPNAAADFQVTRITFMPYPRGGLRRLPMKDLVLKICAMTIMLLSLVSTTHLFAE